MSVSSFYAIYLGNLADLDPDEGRYSSNAENAFPTLGGTTFGSKTDPLFGHTVNITVNDKDGSGDVQFNDVGSTETISYLKNGVTTVGNLDTLFLVDNVTVTRALTGGKTDTITSTVRIVQDTNGNVFLLPPPTVASNSEISAMTDHPVIGITFPTTSRDFRLNYDGMYANRTTVPFLDGIVNGTDGADTITVGDYVDPQGDRVDAGDAIIPGHGKDDDVIQAALGDDVVIGGHGNDTIEGGGGNDSLCGSDGDDRIYGELGNDVLLGEKNNDRLYGGDGNDTLDGGEGRDSLNGEAGDDVLTGGEGFDTFVASGGSDTITDFGLATGAVLNDGNQSNNDFIDLRGFYNDETLAKVNEARAADGLPPYNSPLAWMRADFADDGRLNQSAGLDLTIRGTNASGLTYDTTNVICFSAEALIEADGGPVPAGRLGVGDLVLTRDAGLQPLRWIGRRRITADELAAAPNLRPIRIRAGALGAGTPASDLVVSPQHRMLVRSAIAQRMFGTPEVLVAAKHLLALDGVEVAEDVAEVTYVHLLCDEHQIIFANGAESETLFTGAEALRMVGPAARAEILAIFPQLADGFEDTVPARQIARGHAARRLALRHRDNSRALLG